MSLFHAWKPRHLAWHGRKKAKTTSMPALSSSSTSVSFLVSTAPWHLINLHVFRQEMHCTGMKKTMPCMCCMPVYIIVWLSGRLPIVPLEHFDMPYSYDLHHYSFCCMLPCHLCFSTTEQQAEQEEKHYHLINHHVSYLSIISEHALTLPE